LWPREAKTIEDVPYDLVVAIEQGYTILGWYENLTNEERPPKWTWHLDHELVEWFKELDRKRKEKFNIDSDDDESPEMMQNEYSKGRGR
jgi:hypothetical protein